MKKIAQKEIAKLIYKGDALDLQIGCAYEEEWYRVVRSYDLERIAYSSGTNGLTGLLFRGRKDGKLYAISGRNSALMMAQMF